MEFYSFYHKVNYIILYSKELNILKYYGLKSSELALNSSSTTQLHKLRQDLSTCSHDVPLCREQRFFFLVEVELIYNVVLVSGVQQSVSVMHIYIYIFFRFSSLEGYLNILGTVPVLYNKTLLFIFYSCVYMLLSNS